MTADRSDVAAVVVFRSVIGNTRLDGFVVLCIISLFALYHWRAVVNFLSVFKKEKKGEREKRKEKKKEKKKKGGGGGGIF